MANIRQGVPPGWHWRGQADGTGRPRWIPSPTLRKAGWKGLDLQDGKGDWLGRGPSIAAADAVVQAVAAWRAGRPVPVTLAATAPEGACDEIAAPAGAEDPFSIGALMEAYAGNPDKGLEPCRELKFRKNGEPRPHSTVDDYRRKLKRLVDALAGYARLPDPADPKEKAAHAMAVAKVRAASVFILQPEEGPQGMVDPLRKAYWKLHEHAGVHMAFGVMACASAWLAWCRRLKSRRIHNWAEEVDRETPPGRIRVLTWAEIAALTAAAEKLNRPEVADAILLALDLGWSQVDVLNLTWDRVVNADGALRALTGGAGRQKTGRVGGTPFLTLGKRRIATIVARQKAMAAHPLKVIHLTRQRLHKARLPAADSDFFRDLFAEVRAEAAKACPSLATATFADLRDTAFTLGRQAGLNDDQTASRTLQSRANVKAHADRSYGEIGPAIANAAAELLDPYIEAQLKKHKVKL